jgi:ribulose-5-phosphate 4-epimerase/fuculose-1-phosphate aldolase
VAHFGWDDLIFTHVSARVPGPEHHFLINPYGMFFDEITASSLVKVDLQGRKVMDSPYEINPAGFTIHSAIHAAREDAKCVLHVHSLNGVAVSAQDEGVLPVSQQSIFVLSSLAYHAYEGVALNEAEKPRLVRDLGDKSFFMLRNHGLLTVGESVPDAFLFMYVFEAACAIQIRAQASPKLIPIDPRIIAGAQAQAREVTRGAGAGLAWPGLLRKLDRTDATYRT